MTSRSGQATLTWTRNLITLAVAAFFVNFGSGLLRGASTNFFVDTLGLSGKHVLWLTGLREIPGLFLMFIAAATSGLPLAHRTALAVLLMGVGYGLYALVHSFTGLVAVALIASLGFHNWMPLSSALALSLTTRELSGRVMGMLSSVRSLAAIVGMAGIALVSKLVPSMSLRAYYVIGGALIACAALLLFRLPTDIGAAEAEQRRLLLKKRYWLYYVLTFFEGSRMQVFGTFGTLILVQNYGLAVWQISLLLLASSVVNLVASPLLGHAIDRFGERLTLSISYILLAFCFAGYATLHNAWLLSALLILINVLVLFRIGLSTYVRRIAPVEELTPTLSAGVSVNHITSVAASLVAGSLLQALGYEALCWGAAGLIMASVPFAMAIRTRTPAPKTALAAGE